MKLLLKSADGEAISLTIKESDTFSDLKTQLVNQNGFDVSIEDFNIADCPIQDHFNVINYFKLKNELENNVPVNYLPLTENVTEVNNINKEVSASHLNIASSSNAKEYCRLCAKLFPLTVLNNLQVCYDKIKTFVPIHIDETDLIQQWVCCPCLNMVNTCYNFIQSCVKSQKLFENIRKESQVKTSEQGSISEVETFRKVKQKSNQEDHDYLGKGESDCPICLNAASGDKPYLSYSEFFEALEKHNSRCMKDAGDEMSVFCSQCQRTVSLAACLQGSCHTADVCCCFLCEATLPSAYELREHLKGHLCKESKLDESVVLWRCTKCDLEFASMATFEEHVKQSHGQAQVVNSPNKTVQQNQRQVFRCQVCQKMFRCEARLAFHEQFHKQGARAGHCAECRKEFPSESCLYKHMIYNHMNPKSFTCPTCGKQLRNKSSLTYHARSHTSLEAMRPFSCDLCKKRFARKNILRDHMTNRHFGGCSTQPSTALQCRVCSEAFPNTASAISHMEMHHMGKADKTAGYSFDMMSVHKLFICDRCDKCFCQPGVLMNHRLQHYTGVNSPCYQCKMCNEEFPNYVELRVHVDGHVSDGIADYRQEFEVPALFLCEYCEKCFKSYHAFTTHTNTHLGRDPEPYHCRFCSMHFATYMVAIQHRNSHSKEDSTPRTSDSLKPFECQYCDKSFCSGSALTKHIRTHTGEKPYCCQVCSKRFSQSSGLYTHLKVHSNVRPYQCDICSSSFKILGDYKQHVRKHSGARPYPCQDCDKTFSTRQSFCQHRRIHALPDSFPCQACQKSFKSLHSLKIHLRSHSIATEAFPSVSSN